MSWLKSMGSVMGKVLGILPTFAPVLTAVIPGGVEIGAVINVLFSVEKIFAAAYGPDAKKGSDKLRAASPLVGQLIQSSAVFQGKVVKDAALVSGGFTKITDGFADVLNGYGE